MVDDSAKRKGDQGGLDDRFRGPGRLSGLRKRAAAFAQNARAPATDAAYDADWRDFTRWCCERGVDSLPAQPESVALYLVDSSARLRVSTLQRRLAAIVVRHRREGVLLDPREPAIRDVWRGIRRTLGVEKKGKTPLLASEIREIVGCLPTSLAGKRDKAILLLGFCGALRRSELVNLTIADITFTSEGVILHVGREKNDQEGKGSLRPIPRGEHKETCPAAAVKGWITAAGLDEGPLFRPIDRFGRIGSEALWDGSIARVIKAAVRRCGKAKGMSAKKVKAWEARVAGHSLRAGFATTAAAIGAREWEIMRQTGHKKRESVRGYIRLGSMFRGTTVGKLGL